MLIGMLEYHTWISHIFHLKQNPDVAELFDMDSMPHPWAAGEWKTEWWEKWTDDEWEKWWNENPDTWEDDYWENVEGWDRDWADLGEAPPQFQEAPGLEAPQELAYVAV